MSGSRLAIRHLAFTGPNVTAAELTFNGGPNLVWGASNTGKSFALKAIDFMLGGTTPLPSIDELQGYETAWLGFTLNDVDAYTLVRAVSGGAFVLYNGLVTDRPLEQSGRQLGPKHDQKSDNNISRFLLGRLGFDGRFVAKDTFGSKNSLSFRNLANVLLVDETSIQAERSPIEGGQRDDKHLEHSVFRLLLSGADDSAIAQVDSPKKVQASKVTKLELLDELIAEVEQRLLKEYPDIETLDEQNFHIEQTLEIIRAEFDAAQVTVRSLIEKKMDLAARIPALGERLDEIGIHLERFAQLDGVYASDIERLQALEEAGFLLSLDKNRQCPLCGAPPEAQAHAHGLADVEEIRAASVAEVAKIGALRTDLERAVVDLRREYVRVRAELPVLQQQLGAVEAEIAGLVPKVDERSRRLREALSARDRAQVGLSLRAQKWALLIKRGEAEKTKSISKRDKPTLDLSGPLAHDFCQVVARVLNEWHFPGRPQVSFDETTYDLRIDGKRRVDNGKGVRAVTHAAFKVALLMFCKERELPHPGFVVLDTPLLTYRDPIKHPKYGELSADERALAQTPLRQHFFEHLHRIRDVGQFIVFENVDLPENIAQLSKLEVFGGVDGEGRAGFFPPKGPSRHRV